MRKLLLSSLALTVVALILPMPSVAAELYKCNGANDVPVYQSQPCAYGEEIRNLTDVKLISVISHPEWIKQAAKEAPRQQATSNAPRQQTIREAPKQPVRYCGRRRAV